MKKYLNFYYGSGFLASCGLAIDGEGRLFNAAVGSGAQGYPLSLIALVAILVVIPTKMMVAPIGIPRAKARLIFVTAFVIMFSAIPILGQVNQKYIDFQHFAKYSIWLFSFLAGILISCRAKDEAFISGVLAASYFIIIINIVDIFLEFTQCGIMLCGDGRVAPGFGLPGIYQEYIYLPTLMVFLLCFKYFYIGAHPLHLLLGGFIIIATGSREGLLLLFGVTLLVLGHEKKWISILVSILFVIFGAWAIISGGINFFSEFSIIEKLQKLGGQFQGDNSRISIISQHILLIGDYVIFGNFFQAPFSHGGRFFIDQPSAHNAYVDVLAAGGLYLGILYFSFIFLICILLYRVGSNRLGVFIFFVAFLIISMNINVPLRAPIISVPLFLVIGVLASRVKMTLH